MTNSYHVTISRSPMVQPVPAVCKQQQLPTLLRDLCKQTPHTYQLLPLTLQIKENSLFWVKSGINNLTQLSNLNETTQRYIPEGYYLLS
jgi:hypothetical protein